MVKLVSMLLCRLREAEVAVTRKGVGMRRVRQINPIARAVGVFGAVTILATGVTFALQTNATVSGSTISAQAGLVVRTSEQEGWRSTASIGLSFDGIVFGNSNGDGTYGVPVSQPFAIKNTMPAGSGESTLRLRVNPAITFRDNAGQDITAAVNKNKVHVTMSCQEGGTVPRTLANLEAVTGSVVSGALANSFSPGDEENCTLKVSMETEAYTGSQAEIHSDVFNLVFSANNN